MTKAVDFELKYPPEYVPEKNITIYRVPLGVPEGTIPNAEDDGYSVYVSDVLTSEEAKQEALHGHGHGADHDWNKPSVQQIELDQHHIQKNVQLESLDKASQKRKREEAARRKWERLKKKLDRERKRLEADLAKRGIYDVDQWVFEKIERERLEPPY